MTEHLEVDDGEDHEAELAWLNESIEQTSELPAGWSADPPVELLLLRGQLLYRRYELLPDTPEAGADLVEARSLLRVAAGAVAIDHAAGDERPGLQARVTLGLCCAFLYDLHGLAADAEEAIEALRAAVPHVLPIDPAVAAALAVRLAELLWNQTLGPADPMEWLPWLDEAAGQLDLAVRCASDTDLRDDALVLRALVATRRWACGATGPDPAASTALRLLLAGTLDEVPDHPERWQVEWAFAERCHDEYLDGDDVRLLEQALQHWEPALRGARGAGAAPAELLGEYASSLASRWHLTDSVPDRDRAIALNEEAISGGTEPEPMWLLESGLLLATRYGDRNPDPDGDLDAAAMADLDASALRCSAAAAALAPAGGVLAQLAATQTVISHTERLRFLGEDPAFIDHVNRAIEITEPVLADWVGDDDDRAILVYCLGFQMLRRFCETVDQASLTRAVELLSTAYYHHATRDDPDIAEKGLLLAIALNAADRCGLVHNGAAEAARLVELHGEHGQPGDAIHDAANLIPLVDQLVQRATEGRTDWQEAKRTFLEVPTGGAKGRQARLRELAGLTLLLRTYDNASARDVQAAVAHLRRLRETGEPGGGSYRSATLQLAFVSMLAALQGWQLDGLSPADTAANAIDLVTEVLPSFPPADPMRNMAQFVLGTAHLLHTVATGATSGEALRRCAADQVAGMTQALQAMEGLPGQWGAIGARLARMLAAISAGLIQGPADVPDAVGELRAIVGDADERDGYTDVYRLGLAQVLVQQYDRTRDRSCLVEAVEQLRAALAGTVPGGPLFRRDASDALATAMRKLAEHPGGSGEGVRRQSRAAAISALRSYGELSVLQSRAADAATLVQEAGAKTAAAVAWCLDDRAWSDAVLALEAGRALTLKAALTWASVPERLRMAGYPELAVEWDRTNPAVSSAAPALVGGGLLPNDLPARAVSALGQEIIEPPRPAAIGAALRTLERDALVYLVPGDPGRPGHAVIIDSRGDVTGAGLPHLVDVPDGELDRYHRVHDGLRAATTEAQRHRSRKQWIIALDGLTTWAWTAAMGPVLSLVGAASAAPRVIVVPVGRLSGVPWHAARSRSVDRSTGRPRYALDRAVISYAASAQLLLDCAARPAMRADGTALLVGNPTADPGLDWAELEATALWRTFYPHGDYYGMVADLGDGRPPDRTLRECTHLDLLAALPGGARPRPVVHLSCHAGMPREAHPASVLGARLRLGPGGLALSVASALRQAAGRPAGSPGPLVDLAACGTHLTGELHDEALTLATAFMAAGAATVLGSLWRVMDRRTALLMFVVHHHLRVVGLRADEALRRTQLWMLDPARQPLPGMPPAFRDLVRAPHLVEPRGWAPFVHQGR